MKEEAILKETWHTATMIDEETWKYRKLKWRTVERIGFWIRPIGQWFFPCKEDQQRLKDLIINGKWIFGNKDYEPAVELQRSFDEIDDDSWVTLEEREPTKEEKGKMQIGEFYEE